MKYNVQIPTIQFGLIGAELDGTAQDAVMAHNELIEAYRASQSAGEGLTPKEFNVAVDEFNMTGSLKDGPDLYARMNKEQQFYFQVQKKSLKRIEAKNEKDIEYKDNLREITD